MGDLRPQTGWAVQRVGSGSWWRMRSVIHHTQLLAGLCNIRLVLLWDVCIPHPQPTTNNIMSHHAWHQSTHQDRGVDFPVRPPREDTGVPYYTPPAPASIPGHGPGQDDLSPEDAAAINAALQQMEAEEAERQQREAALAPPGGDRVCVGGVGGSGSSGSRQGDCRVLWGKGGWATGRRSGSRGEADLAPRVRARGGACGQRCCMSQQQAAALPRWWWHTSLGRLCIGYG